MPKKEFLPSFCFCQTPVDKCEWTEYNRIHKTRQFLKWPTTITQSNHLDLSRADQKLKHLLKDLNTDSLGTLMTYVGSLFQCLQTLLGKKCFLMSSLSQHWAIPCHGVQGTSAQLCPVHLPSPGSCTEQGGSPSVSFSPDQTSPEPSAPPHRTFPPAPHELCCPPLEVSRTSIFHLSCEGQNCRMPKKRSHKYWIQR